MGSRRRVGGDVGFGVRSCGVFDWLEKERGIEIERWWGRNRDLREEGTVI